MVGRDIPAAVQSDLEGEASGHALIAFLEIRHHNLADPIRVVSDLINYQFEGETWTGIPFDVVPLNDDDQVSFLQISVPNTDRRIGQALRDAQSRAVIRMVVCSTLDFDLSVDPRAEVGSAAPVLVVEDFELFDVQADAGMVTGRALVRDYSQEPFPALRVTQRRTPGLFF